VVIGFSCDQEKSIKDKVDSLAFDTIEFWSAPTVNDPEIKVQVYMMLFPIKKWEASISIPSKLPACMFLKKSTVSILDKHTDTFYNTPHFLDQKVSDSKLMFCGLLRGILV